MNQGLDLSNEVHSRTMRDFLELYNKVTNHCFDKCISNFNHRAVSTEEAQCVSSCTDKYLAFNQRHMLVFMEHQTNKQKMAAKAAESASVQGESAAGTMLSGETNGETPSAVTQVTSSTQAGVDEAVPLTQTKS